MHGNRHCYCHPSEEDFDWGTLHYTVAITNAEIATKITTLADIFPILIMAIQYFICPQSAYLANPPDS